MLVIEMTAPNCGEMFRMEHVCLRGKKSHSKNVRFYIPIFPGKFTVQFSSKMTEDGWDRGRRARRTCSHCRGRGVSVSPHNTRREWWDGGWYTKPPPLIKVHPLHGGLSCVFHHDKSRHIDRRDSCLHLKQTTSKAERQGKTLYGKKIPTNIEPR